MKEQMGIRHGVAQVLQRIEKGNQKRQPDDGILKKIAY
jgi:hypothetical protein